MKNLNQLSKDYQRIEKAIHFLGENFQTQPDLNEMAKAAGLSEFHFQRVFQRWAGISPKRFVQFLTKEHAKKQLKISNLLDASYEAGLSGPGRLHDLFVSCEAMTPGEYKEKGRGLTIEYGFHPTPFGECFMAVTNCGICALSFQQKSERNKVLQDFRRRWANATVKADQAKTKEYIEQIFLCKKGKITLLLGGTNFQIKVWEGLLKIPRGSTLSYGAFARRLGCPKSARAVGSAIGKNAIGYLIPCHRVIREMGGLGGYRWGTSRKKAILAFEAA